MKSITDILKDFGLSVPEEKTADFDKAIKENYKTVAEVQKIEAARDNYKSQAELSSIGGDTSGVSLPHNLHWCGEKTFGDFNPTTKTFTAVAVG